MSKSKYHWPIIASFIMLGVSLIITFIICINPTFNLCKTWPFDKDLSSSFGTLLGGVLGPLLSVVSFFIVYQSLKEQINAKKDQDFKTHYYELIKYNREHVSSIKYVNSAEKPQTLVEGSDFFITAKKQLDHLYDIISKHLGEKSIKEKIGITFTIFYYGAGENTKDTLCLELKKYKLSDSEINNILQNIRKIKTEYNKKIVYYGGHQGKLAHYFRQLFYIIKHIDESDLHTFEEKKEMIKIIRVQMSNYEQAILLYNSFTILGKAWINNQYIVKYELVKNIPQRFLPDEINISELFPEIVFEDGI